MPEWRTSFAIFYDNAGMAAAGGTELDDDHLPDGWQGRLLPNASNALRRPSATRTRMAANRAEREGCFCARFPTHAAHLALGDPIAETVSFGFDDLGRVVMLESQPLSGGREIC